MSKTADVLQAIWTDPWFLDLSTDAKCLYLWGITTDHGNQAGLFVIARKVIEMETALTPERLDKALEELGGKIRYEVPTGALWVVGKAKRIRMKTKQIAVSILKAWKECPSEQIAADFAEKYGEATWLLKEGISLNDEPHPNLPRTSKDSSDRAKILNLTRSSSELQGQGQGQGLKEGRGSGGNHRTHKFNGKSISDARLMLATMVLKDFNDQAGTNFDPYTAAGDMSDSLRRIVGALTAWPDKLSSDYCRRLTTATLRSRWWGQGPATVGVVFGPRVIEQNMARVDGNGNGQTPRSDWERLTGKSA